MTTEAGGLIDATGVSVREIQRRGEHERTGEDEVKHPAWTAVFESSAHSGRSITHPVFIERVAGKLMLAAPPVKNCA